MEKMLQKKGEWVILICNREREVGTQKRKLLSVRIPLG